MERAWAALQLAARSGPSWHTVRTGCGGGSWDLKGQSELGGEHKLEEAVTWRGGSPGGRADLP